MNDNPTPDMYDSPEELQKIHDEAKKGFIERGTALLREIDNTKEDLKTLLSDAKKAGFDPKELRALITANFKNELQPKLEMLEKHKAELDRLFGEF